MKHCSTDYSNYTISCNYIYILTLYSGLQDRTRFNSYLYVLTYSIRYKYRVIQYTFFLPVYNYVTSSKFQIKISKLY